MDFDFTDEEQEIKRAARDALSRHSTFEQVRAAAERGAYDPQVFRLQTELGWTGIAIDDDYGGSGLGIVALIVLLEESGYALASSPLLSSVCAALAIQAAGSTHQREEWLPRLADGSATGALGLLGPVGGDIVADAADADVIVLIEDGTARLVCREDADLTPVEAIDLTRRYARIAPDCGEPLPGEVTGALDAARVAVSAELVGVCQRALDITVEYVKDREQFGRSIGSFQAVQHMLVEMLQHTEVSRSGTYWAAWLLDAGDPGAHEAALIAKAAASDGGRIVATNAMQAHGGIGFTWEADLHWLYKRAQLDARALGSAQDIRRELSSMIAGRAHVA